MTKAFRKYFQHYAEAEVADLCDFPRHYSFTNAVVIPAYKESPEFIERFIETQTKKRSCLLILVVNQPDYEQDSKPQHALYQHAMSKGEATWYSQGCDKTRRGSLKLVTVADSKSAILLVDRYSVPVSESEGVGKARKIGADIASFLYFNQQVTSPFFHSTDADATLPIDYFDATCRLKQNDVACCYDFFHRSNEQAVHDANALYESALKYYVAGLQYASSPYAFFTIGSILAVRFSAYITARGFPKKSAGEDFYLLNKVAKLGRVARLTGCTVELEARVSDRVPFGTGPAVSKIMALLENGEDYCYYNPLVFEHLKHLYSCLHELAAQRSELSLWLSVQPRIFTDALLAINFPKFVKNQSNSDDVQFLKQFHVWFDAFKTLKFIHALRELGLKDVPLIGSLDSASFLN